MILNYESMRLNKKLEIAAEKEDILLTKKTKRLASNFSAPAEVRRS